VDRGLRDLVEQGARAAQGPQIERLRRRSRRRRARRTTGGALLALAAAALTLPLLTGGHPRSVPAALTPTGALTTGLAADPSHLAAGARTNVHGAGCDSAAPVYLSLGAADKPRELATVTASRDGSFHAVVVIPPDTQPGLSTLWAACKAPNPTGKLAQLAVLHIAPG
jgi:hypothetical protein